MDEPSDKPIIGISECLTECIVRYDAKSQFNKALIMALSKNFELLPICPEVESGLGVPRPAIKLVEIAEGISVIGRDDKNLDVSEQLITYSQKKILSLNHISGYIFKARSPSCGVMNSPLYDLEGNVKRYTNGVFVSRLIKQYPCLPVIDDSALDKDNGLEVFIESVFNYVNAEP